MPISDCPSIALPDNQTVKHCPATFSHDETRAGEADNSLLSAGLHQSLYFGVVENFYVGKKVFFIQKVAVLVYFVHGSPDAPSYFGIDGKKNQKGKIIVAEVEPFYLHAGFPELKPELSFHNLFLQIGHRLSA